MKKLSSAILSVVLFSLLISCNKILLNKPTSQSDDTIDYSKYRTYALSFETSTNPDTVAMQQAIGREIIYQMNLRGYREAFPTPELLIHFSLHPKNVEVPEFATFRRTGVVYSQGTHFAIKGALVIRMFDVRTRNLVWATYIDRLNRFGKWDDKLLKLKVKNLFINFKEFRKA
ncbi:MAG: DUF4136 domain-containing protein [Spirosomaceae bacterium]|jgi:hypothetical protein|nr:DUF4136 domain-containing protein [Spirosomataceae bacterium]